MDKGPIRGRGDLRSEYFTALKGWIKMVRHGDTFVPKEPTTGR